MSDMDQVIVFLQKYDQGNVEARKQAFNEGVNQGKRQAMAAISSMMEPEPQPSAEVEPEPEPQRNPEHFPDVQA